MNSQKKGKEVKVGVAGGKVEGEEGRTETDEEEVDTVRFKN